MEWKRSRQSPFTSLQYVPLCLCLKLSDARLHHKSATAAATEAALSHNRPPANATPFSPQHLQQRALPLSPEKTTSFLFFFSSSERRNRDICRHTLTLICKSHLHSAAHREESSCWRRRVPQRDQSLFCVEYDFGAELKADRFDHTHAGRSNDPI